MKPIQHMLIASLMVALASATMAQGGGGAHMGSAPAAQAPGPAADTGGMRTGRGSARAGMAYTPGWSLMTPKEREQHRQRMLSMTTYEECKTYMNQHHEQMMARAKARGGKVLPRPRRDACAGLKP